MACQFLDWAEVEAAAEEAGLSARLDAESHVVMLTLPGEPEEGCTLLQACVLANWRETGVLAEKLAEIAAAREARTVLT